MRVLICDDDAVLRQLLTKVFTSVYRAETVQATNGKEALEQLDNGPVPDIIILDHMMPQMDGLSALEQLKGRFSGMQKRPKVLVYSAFDLSRQARGAGADAFLKKPSTVSDLKKVIDGWLGVK